MSKIKDVVSWVMMDDKILKLKEENKTYDLSDPVVEFIKKNKLDEKEDFSVEVEIDESKGENGTITKLKEANSNAKADPGKTEKPDTSEPTVSDKDNVTKELTVHGVSVEKKGVIFKEEEKAWYTLDDSLNAQEFKDSCTGKTIEVYIEETSQGNDIIKGFTVKEEVKADTEPPKEKKQYNNASKSIEAQASLKCAKSIVSSMVDKDSKPDFVLGLITKIAEHSYKTLQDLKNKE